MKALCTALVIALAFWLGTRYTLTPRASWADNGLRSREEIDKMGAWSRIESDKSAHVWAKDPTKVYNSN